MKRQKVVFLSVMVVLLLLLCACSKNQKPVKTVVALETTAPTPTGTPIAGDWYGWWRCIDAEGDWAYMDGYCWDCLAQLREESDGTCSLLIWNENHPKEKYLLGESLRINESVLECLSGSFLDVPFTQDKEQRLELQDKNGPLLFAGGSYREPKGGFRYEIWLRPWGESWPEPEDERPETYESWYLPLIEGESTMPDHISN